MTVRSRLHLAARGLLVAVASLGLWWTAPHGAEAATIRASLHPSAVSLGEEARLVVEVSGTSRAPQPVIPPVDGLEIHHVGQTMSMEFVDGAMSTEVQHTFGVRPTRVGEFRIPPLSIEMDGETLWTQASVLRVVAAGKVPRTDRPPAAGTAPTPPPARKPGRPDAGDEPRIAFAEIVGLPDRQLFVGEVLPIDIVLYVREGTRVTEATPPSITSGSFTLARPSEDEPKQERVRLSDGVYTRLTFPAALSPITAGRMPLSASLELTARVPKRVPRQRGRFGDPFFDSFFDSFSYRAVEQKVPVTSKPITVRVAALPADGRPESFTGGVGHFEMKVSAEPTRVAVGDPVTLHVEVRGRGNFDRLQLPDATTSRAWKTYDATSEFHADDPLGLSGQKTFEQALLPLRPDISAIPARELSYFDPVHRRYVTLESPAIPIEVVGAPPRRLAGAATAPATSTGAYDLAPNRIDLGAVYASLAPTATHRWFLALQIVPVLAAGAAIAWGRRRRRLAADPTHRRNRQRRRALQDLARRMDAAAASGDSAGFFEAARRALQERVGGGDGDAVATSLTLREIERRLEGRVDLDGVREVFVAADALAYGREGADPADLHRLRDEVAALLERLNRTGLP